jgi:retinol dehydrogenase-12
MSTNILGPYLFSHLLYPILKQTAESAPVNSVRVCWASSLLIEMSPKGGVDMDDSGSPILSNSRYTNYFVSKAANNLIASEFGKRHKRANILSVVCYPFFFLPFFVISIYPFEIDFVCSYRTGL